MNLKLLKTLTATVLLFVFISGSVYAENGSVISNYVNLRSGPSTSSDIIECLVRGTVIEITDKSTDGWYAVNYNGKSGYMASDYINILPSSLVISGGTPFETNDVSPSPSPTSVSSEPSVESTVPSVLPASTSIPTIQPTQTPEPTPEPTAEPTTTPVIAEAETKSGYINGDYVRFRSGPSLTASIYSTYNRGKDLSILGISGDWTQVSIDGKEGFVYSQYVKAEENQSVASIQISSETTSVESAASSSSNIPATDGYVCGNNVRFRSGPSTSSSIIGEFFFGNPISIIETVSDWTKIISGDTIGYVYSSYIKSGSFSSGSSSDSNTSANVSGQEIVDYAMTYLGYKYFYGGQLPETGFDCSGFVCYVYNHFNYSLNRVAADQAKNGVSVDSSALQPGDILLFYSNGSIGHSGIYIGNNMFIHAANSNTGVIVTSLDGYYSNRGFIARRIVS